MTDRITGIVEIADPSPFSAAYRTEAIKRHWIAGGCEIDDTAPVRSEDGGAWVAAWIWVSDTEVANGQ